MAHTVATMLAGKKARRLKLADFLLTWGRKRQTSEDQLAVLRGLAARQGGNETHDDR